MICREPPVVAAGSSPRIGLLLSGGLDSAILLDYLLQQGREVQPFYIRSGLVWQDAELASLQKLLTVTRAPKLRELVIFDLPLQDLYGTHWSITGQAVPDARSADEAVFLPGRNALLLLKPAIWCQLNGFDELALAPLGTSPFADATDEFFAAFQQMLGYSGDRQVRILHPFRQTEKRQVMQLGGRVPLELTFSCIAPVAGLHCGACNKCAERQVAFQEAARPDATAYCR